MKRKGGWGIKEPAAVRVWPEFTAHRPPAPTATLLPSAVSPSPPSRMTLISSDMFNYLLDSYAELAAVTSPGPVATSGSNAASLDPASVSFPTRVK